MLGVTEYVKIPKLFLGIVQNMQLLPVGLERAINPLMASYSDFERVSMRHILDC